MKHDISNLIKEEEENINQLITDEKYHLAGRYNSSLGLMYEYIEKWEDARKCYKESIIFLNRGIDRRIRKNTIKGYEFTLLFPLTRPYFKLNMDDKARETLERILKYLDYYIMLFKSGNENKLSGKLNDIAYCALFLENFKDAYTYTKYNVDFHLKRKNLSDYSPYYIIYLLSKAKLENNIDFAKQARHNIFKYERGERKEKIKYKRPLEDLFALSDLLSKDVNADIKQVLRIGGWPLPDTVI
jgi:hypothetical protein